MDQRHAGVLIENGERDGRGGGERQPDDRDDPATEALGEAPANGLSKSRVAAIEGNDFQECS